MENQRELLKCINRIKTSEKEKINEITRLAKQVKNDEKFVDRISDVLIGKVTLAPCEKLKLVYFYVIDSILKNICEPYQSFLAKHVVSAFVESYKSCKDKTTKIRFEELRKTWTKKYFTDEILYEIDSKILTTDPNWTSMSTIRMGTHKRKRDFNSENFNNKENMMKIIKLETLTEAIKTEAGSVSPMSPKTVNMIKLEPVENDIKIDVSIGVTTKTMTDAISDFSQKWSTLEIMTLLKQVPNGVPTLQENIQEDKINTMPTIYATQNCHNISTPMNVFENFINSVPLSQPLVHFNQMPIQHHYGPTPLPFIPAQINIRNIPPPLFNGHSINQANNILCQEPLKTYPKHWNNNIDGFPMMPKISTDPRLLFPVHNPRTPEHVTIDNDDFVVLLDRIQPCVFHRGNYHVVRFACSYIKMMIDGTEIELSVNEINFVRIRNIPMTLIIGGPFHEIILNGEPHHVPMTGNIYNINVHGIILQAQFRVKKTFRLRLMDFIPSYIFNWVEAGFFGYPSEMHHGPMNPLNNPMLNDNLSQRYRNEIFVKSRNESQLPKATDSCQRLTVTPPQTNLSQNSPTFNNLKIESKIKELSFRTFDLDDFKCFDEKTFLATNRHTQPKPKSNEVGARQCREFLKHSKFWQLSIPTELHPDVSLPSGMCEHCNGPFQTMWDDLNNRIILKAVIYDSGKIYHTACADYINKANCLLDLSTETKATDNVKNVDDGGYVTELLDSLMKTGFQFPTVV